MAVRVLKWVSLKYQSAAVSLANVCADETIYVGVLGILYLQLVCVCVLEAIQAIRLPSLFHTLSMCLVFFLSVFFVLYFYCICAVFVLYLCYICIVFVSDGAAITGNLCQWVPLPRTHV